MAERWDRARVLTLAPDASSLRAAQPLASGRSWPLAGAADGSALWGECLGSAAAPYRTVVDLSGPAYRCSCPSRKFPCKHALALLLLWSDGVVAVGGGPPEWVRDWLASREAAAASAKDPQTPADPAAALRRAEREQRQHLAHETKLRSRSRQGSRTIWPRRWPSARRW